MRSFYITILLLTLALLAPSVVTAQTFGWPLPQGLPPGGGELTPPQDACVGATEGVEEDLTKEWAQESITIRNIRGVQRICLARQRYCRAKYKSAYSCGISLLRAEERIFKELCHSWEGNPEDISTAEIKDCKDSFRDQYREERAQWKEWIRGVMDCEEGLSDCVVHALP